MSTQHTPGPWKAADDHPFAYAVNESGNNRFAASVMGGWVDGREVRTTDAELMANARLIAAAPELLKALRDLELAANTVDGCYTRNPANFALALRDLGISANAARAAIVKATEATL